MQKKISLALIGPLAWLGLGCAGVGRGIDGPPDELPNTTFDLVVYGGTSAGVVAARRAALDGYRVALIAPEPVLGGLSASGLGATDIGNKAAIGGMAREFYRRVRAHYEADGAWSREKVSEFRGRGHRLGEDTAWTFEPHVAESIFEEWAATPGITLIREEALDRNSSRGDEGVSRQDGKIRAIRIRSGRLIPGRVFIDASYEGDLLAAGGVSFRVGREANHEYDETLNGVQFGNAVHHQFQYAVDPHRKPGEPDSGLLPGIESKRSVDGSGDHRVQAYCFRLCLTDVPENRLPWRRPSDYDESRYELLFRMLEASVARGGKAKLPIHSVAMPNRKTDSNNNGPFSTDFIGGSHRYPEADDGTRRRIVASHESYQRGLMWTLAHHERIPENVRAYFQEWGLAADEFESHGHWPPLLYIREARRMIGRSVMTEQHCRGARHVEDPVGLAAYTMDSHHVQRVVDREGAVRNEGDVQVGGFSPYGIGFGAIVPHPSECTNLLVPVCLSATHIAFGSIRMEPVFMVLAESAAVAAELAIDGRHAVQEVRYSALRQRLVELDQRITWSAREASDGGVPVASLPGVVVDDGDATRVGSWQESRSVPGFVGRGYLHDGNVGKGSAAVVYPLVVPRPGRYEIRFSYTAHGNRASNVPVTIEHADGVVEIEIDERRSPPIDGRWVAIATVRLRPGRPGSLRVSTIGTDGYVVVDAVQLVRSE